MDSTATAVRSLATGDVRGVAEIGRAARLELRFGVRVGRTVLSHAYAEPPFRVGQPFADGDGLHLIVASSAPGIFGGDRFVQSVIVEAGARVRLTSQSALQVHPSTDGAVAAISNSFVVGEGASLICEWDAVIPFPHASLKQRLSVDLAPTARLFWSDAMMAGREARGERWLFDRLDHELRVSRGGALSYLERYVVEPRVASVQRRWLADSAAYFGSIVSIGDSETSVDAAQGELSKIDGVVGAVDRVEPDVVLARLMAASGVPFRAGRRVLGPA